MNAAINLNISEADKYSVFTIADWFLTKEEMTHRKLQMLCYYAQAWCYALNNYRLQNTDFLAWTCGPVSPELWRKYGHFDYYIVTSENIKKNKTSKKDIELLENVWDTYGESTGNALSALAQRELPWVEARIGYQPNEKCNVIISSSTMAYYYRSIYQIKDV